jgi:anti-anti-sigma factor
MEYTFERNDAAAIFILNGRIDSGGSIGLDHALKAELIEADTAVLFDMTGVPYMSSAGIRVFSVLEKTLRQRNGHLYLWAVQPAVAKVLTITGFDRVFTSCSTRNEALVKCRPVKPTDEIRESTVLPVTTHTRLSSETFADHPSVVKISGSGVKACRVILEPEDLVPRPFAPDEYCAGTGAPGDSVTESFPDTGMFITLGGAIFWRPFGSRDLPDFLIPRTDAPRVLLSTAFSAACDGQFHEIIVAEPVSFEGFSLGDLCSDILRHAKASRSTCPPVMSIVMYAGTRDPAETPGTGRSAAAKGPISPPGDKTLVSFGICIDMGADLSAYDPELLENILCQKDTGDGDKDIFLYQHGLVFDTPPVLPTRDITRLVTETVTQEPCTDLIRVSPETILSRAVLGVSYHTSIVHTDDMPVRIRGECPGWNRTYETIARWLHPGCRELELIPLTGGFSGTLVFRVNARDGRGSSMMPLVMKLGPWPLIDAEIRGYTDHVKRYIQNNATRIIETERVGDFGGILYNFVGIRGMESKIFSLEDFYFSHTADEIILVFDSLFHVVLRGWYGEPRKKEMFLYREYDRFWKYDEIRSYAALHFGATPDQEEIELPFGLGKSTNPLWFVEQVMPGRMTRPFTVYESSVHGDLNMKNVLMDETNNLWLIDFAETRYSHILRDIVKLEAVIKGEMVPLTSRETLEELVRRDIPFLTAKSLSDIPDPAEISKNPAMEKAFRVAGKLRSEASRITLTDDDITQYYIGLLPFTLNLLSYSSVNEYQKEYGWIAASLICRQLL